MATVPILRLREPQVPRAGRLPRRLAHTQRRAGAMEATAVPMPAAAARMPVLRTAAVAVVVVTLTDKRLGVI